MRKYIPYIVIAILIMVLLGQCSAYKNNKSRAKDIIDILQSRVEYYKNENGTLTATKGALQLTNNELKQIIIEKDAELKNITDEFASIKSIVKYKTVTKFDAITVTYTDTIPCEFERNGTEIAEWYSFKWKTNQYGFRIDSLKTWSTATIITGVKRKWFLGAERVTTDIIINNPAVTVTDITSAEVIINQPWYKKWYVWLGAGVIGGMIISK